MLPKRKMRVSRNFGADGIRHDLVPRILDALELSSAFLLMRVIGKFIQYCVMFIIHV